jgi:DNA-binding transcriptional ArsR family regulator
MASQAWSVRDGQAWPGWIFAGLAFSGLALAEMDAALMDALADYFKVFSEANRLAVLLALEAGPLNVTAVVEKTGLSQALVSKHLKLLTIAGVVRRRPERSLVFYEVIDTEVFAFIARAEQQLLAARRQQLDALAASF